MESLKRLKLRSDEGVSEVGTLMITTLIISVASLLYIISYPIIMDNEEGVRFRKAYFDLLEISEKIENVRSGFQYNSTYTLHLSATSFSFSNSLIFILNNKSYNSSTIKISGRGWELYYENGAIIEKRPTYSKLLQYPSVNHENNTLTLPIIRFSEERSFGGTGILTLNLKLKKIEKGSIENCTVKIISQNIESWEKFLKDLGINVVNGTFSVGKVEYIVYEVSIL